MLYWTSDTCSSLSTKLIYYPCIRKERITSTLTTRGITITPILAKTLEHIILSRISPKCLQSPLQFGFTKELSPTMAALAITEAISDACDNHTTLYVIALDVRKAFDVVDHRLLLHRPYQVSDHSSWTYIYGSLNTSAKVKLHGLLGDSFSVDQGVGQGKITSTHSYKVYIDGLLHPLTYSGQGAYIGNIYIGSPTCTDDVILVANNIIELQSQLNIVSDYAKRERYQIHPDKSKLIVFGITNPTKPMLNGKEIPPNDVLTHLGIDRHAGSSTSDDFIEAQISLARRTAYSLMGTGFHGVNGVSPQYSISVYTTYVLPRMLCGLDAITLKEKHVKSLEQFHCNILRQLQTLPTRTATCAIYLLSGVPTLECLLDIQIASLLVCVGRQPSSPLARIGFHQLSVKNTKSSSWYVYVAKRLTRYGLDAVNLLEGNTRNSEIKLTIQQYWLSWLKEAALSKSTLRHLDVTKCNFHNPHSTWGATASNPAETRKAIQKAHLLTGTYLLQSNKAAFNQHQVDATCPLCKTTLD